MKSLIIVLFAVTMFTAGCSAPWWPYPYFNPQKNSEPRPKEEQAAPMDLQSDNLDTQTIEPNPEPQSN